MYCMCSVSKSSSPSWTINVTSLISAGFHGHNNRQDLVSTSPSMYPNSDLIFVLSHLQSRPPLWLFTTGVCSLAFLESFIGCFVHLCILLILCELPFLISDCRRNSKILFSAWLLQRCNFPLVPPSNTECGMVFHEQFLSRYSVCS